MNKTQKLVDSCIRDAQNDIDEYLMADVPLECYQEDIKYKLKSLREQVKKLLEK